MKTIYLSAFVGSVILSACSGGGGSSDGGAAGGGSGSGGGDGGTPPVVVDVVRNTDGSFTVVDDGETLELPAPSSDETSGFELPFLEDESQGILAPFEDNDDFVVVGGIENGEFFSAISGTQSAAPSGSATYDTRYEVVFIDPSPSNPDRPQTIESGSFELDYDFSANTIEGSNSRFEVDGDVTTAGDINGTVTFDGNQADFEGGFFGDDADVAGAFDSDDIGGFFTGTAN